MAEKEATLLLRIKEAGASALDKVVVTFGDLVDVAKAVGEALVKPIEEFRKQEEAVNSLNQAMVQQGIFSTELRQKYLEQASAIQSLTTFADDEVIAAQSMLQSQIGQLEITPQLTKAVADLAAVKKVDLVQAANLVGKSIGSSTNALAREGIQIDANATKTEKLSQVIDGINSKFGGQAEAAAKGLGSLKQLENAFSDILETVGEKFAPLITYITRELINLATAVNTGASPAFNGLVDLFVWVSKEALHIGSRIEDLTASLSGSLGVIAGTIGLAMKGQFAAAKAAYTEGFKDLEAEHKSREEVFLARMDALNSVTKTREEEKNAEDIELLKQSNANKLAVKTEAADLEFNTLDAKRQEERLYEIGLESEEMMSLGQHQDGLLRMKITHLDKMIAAESEAGKKRALNRQKDDLIEKLADEQKAKNREQLQKDTFATIATLSRSGNSTLAAIGKAAGITQIAIDTPVAVSKALAAFPPPFNFAAAGLVGAAMAAQAAQIAGVQLAEGGIVKARPGGIQATIGEGGQDEAVIPLNDSGLSIGTTINLTVYGGLLGDERTAHDLAIALDKEFLKLRRNNESVAFDQRVI